MAWPFVTQKGRKTRAAARTEAPANLTALPARGDDEQGKHTEHRRLLAGDRDAQAGSCPDPPRAQGGGDAHQAKPQLQDVLRVKILGEDINEEGIEGQADQEKELPATGYPRPPQDEGAGAEEDGDGAVPSESDGRAHGDPHVAKDEHHAAGQERESRSLEGRCTGMPKEGVGVGQVAGGHRGRRCQDQRQVGGSAVAQRASYDFDDDDRAGEAGQPGQPELTSGQSLENRTNAVADAARREDGHLATPPDRHSGAYHVLSLRAFAQPRQAPTTTGAVPVAEAQRRCSFISHSCLPNHRRAAKWATTRATERER